MVPRGVSRPRPSGSTGAFVAGAVGAGFVAPGKSEDTCGIANAPVAAQSAAIRNTNKNFLAAVLLLALTNKFPRPIDSSSNQTDATRTCIVLTPPKGGKSNRVD